MPTMFPQETVLDKQWFERLNQKKQNEYNEGKYYGYSVESHAFSLSLKNTKSSYTAYTVCLANAMVIIITVKPTDAAEYGVSVFCDEDGNGFPITIKPERGVLAVGEIEPPFELKPGEDLTPRVFLDRGMVEVFVNGRQAAVTMHAHDKDPVRINLFSKGSDIMASVKAWTMKSIYMGQ